MSSQATVLPQCAQACPIVLELEDTVRELEEENKELKEKIAIKDGRVERLWKKLRRYENPHTPPSRRLGSSRSKSRRSRSRQGKLGDGTIEGKSGHEGVTRPQSEPDNTMIVSEENCTNCGSELGDPTSVQTRIIEDIPKCQTVEVTEYKVCHYQCAECGEEVVASYEDLPPEGRFGYNVVVQATLSKYEQRLPHRKTSDLLRWQHDLDVSPSTVLDLTRRAADWLRPNYEEVTQKVRDADVLYVDETSIKVNGRKGWIWTFTTDDVTLFVIRMSRGKKVLKEVLGEDFYGIIVCDGWSSYATYVKNIAPDSGLQRCWAHLLREADDLKSDEGKCLADGLHELYDELKNFLLGDPPPEERKRKMEWAMETMRELIEKKYNDEETLKLIKKIGNGLDYWFTAVTEPGVELTNNRAERALREHVVQRKIIGTLRNEKGMRIHETVMTMLATWKQKGLDPYGEMHKALRT